MPTCTDLSSVCWQMSFRIQWWNLLLLLVLDIIHHHYQAACAHCFEVNRSLLHYASRWCVHLLDLPLLLLQSPPTSAVCHLSSYQKDSASSPHLVVCLVSYWSLLHHLCSAAIFYSESIWNFSSGFLECLSFFLNVQVSAARVKTLFTLCTLNLVLTLLPYFCDNYVLFVSFRKQITSRYCTVN